MNTCQECGNKYKLDLLVPDQVWEQIKPKGKPEGAGLLCPSCIVVKIEKAIGYAAMRANFISSGFSISGYNAELKISCKPVVADSAPSQECYKTGETCKYGCNGLCKESC